MSDTVHCHLLEIYGPEWSDLDETQVDCIIKNISSLPLLGKEPNKYTFAGSRHIASAIGGYFVVEYEKEVLVYDEKKNAHREYSRAYERIFFVLIADTGYLLLQNRKFVDLPLDMNTVLYRLRQALDQVIDNCNLSRIINMAEAIAEPEKQDFVEEFERSSRVSRLKFANIRASEIPDDFTYYNPQRARNRIVRGSHQHDYEQLNKIDLEARKEGDLKEVHLRDLLFAAEPEFMQYEVGLKEYVMRRELRSRFEFSIDMDADQVPEDQFITVLDTLRRERGPALGVPVNLTPYGSDDSAIAEQLTLQDIMEEKNDKMDA